MAEDKKNIDRKLSTLSRFGLRGRGSGAGPSRLPSLKPARDLTLGGTPKRTFTPNIVARGVKKEEVKDSKDPRHKRERGRGRGFRGRGRGRGRGEIISTSSIFSQGPAAQQTLARALTGGSSFFGGGGQNRDDGPTSSKAVIHNIKGTQEDDVDSNKVFEMLEEEGKIEINENNGGLMPIMLPLASKLVHKIKQDDVKTESELSQDEDEKKPVKKEFKKPVVKTQETLPVVEMTDLFKPGASEGKLFFLQLPDTLPIKPLSHEDDDIKIESSTKTETSHDDIEEHLRRFTFQNVSEGYIGKLRIYESGKATMQLGNVALNVSLGTPCGFLQDLVSIHSEKDPAEMICLGHVNHRFIAVPDYESLLGGDEDTDDDS